MPVFALLQGGPAGPMYRNMSMRFRGQAASPIARIISFFFYSLLHFHPPGSQFTELSCTHSSPRVFQMVSLRIARRAQLLGTVWYGVTERAEHVRRQVISSRCSSSAVCTREYPSPCGAQTSRACNGCKSRSTLQSRVEDFQSQTLCYAEHAVANDMNSCVPPKQGIPGIKPCMAPTVSEQM